MSSPQGATERGDRSNDDVKELCPWSCSWGAGAISRTKTRGTRTSGNAHPPLHLPKTLTSPGGGGELSLAPASPTSHR